MAIVADASPLILFARIDELALLRDTFEEIWVPPVVADEVFRGDPTRPGASQVAAVFGIWLREQVLDDRRVAAALAAEVDAGEAAAIALALQCGLLLLIDDLVGRRAARERGVSVVGSAGTLGLAKRRGLLPAVGPVLDRLLAQGLRLSPALYRQILGDAGEGPSG